VLKPSGAFEKEISLVTQSGRVVALLSALPDEFRDSRVTMAMAASEECKQRRAEWRVESRDCKRVRRFSDSVSTAMRCRVFKTDSLYSARPRPEYGR
jgi:antitoxin (DNA-binding transcriptional repressor) of toxin-antitoxin stability system